MPDGNYLIVHQSARQTMKYVPEIGDEVIKHVVTFAVSTNQHEPPSALFYVHSVDYSLPLDDDHENETGL